MKFDVTADNNPYLDARGKIVLNACPGSGKTTAIAYKIRQLITECEQSFGEFAGVACLSFTNVAKSEILDKYYSLTGNQVSYPNDVRTLDSFVNHYITLPFYYLLNRPAKRPMIMDVVSFLDEMNLGRFYAKGGQSLSRILKPSELTFNLDGSIGWNHRPPNPETVDKGVFDNYAKTFKKWQVNHGYLNNEDSSFIAYRLLLKYPEIARNLVQRFPYVIIDEAQDTSEVQYGIFDRLILNGLSNLEYVGDPYQSLYEFREARPDLFVSRYLDATNWRPLQLTDCRRSSQKIINFYSLFRSIREKPILSICTHGNDHPVKIIRYDPENIPNLILKYESIINSTEKNCILVRGRKHLEMLGAKPSEEKPWRNGMAQMLVHAYVCFKQGKSKAAIDAMRTFFTHAQLPKAGPNEIRKKLESLKEVVDVNIQLFELLRELPTIDDTLKNWTGKVTKMIAVKLMITVDLELKQKGKSFYDLNLKNLLYPENSIPYPVSTIHKVKGMTFDSVLLVLNKDGSGGSLSLKDFTRPSGLPSERQRMIYVALSRPEKQACIAIPNEISELDIKKVLGDEIKFI